jgi:diadenosine tetraphosphate (Ap4A) HIT family hydrolase
MPAIVPTDGSPTEMTTAIHRRVAALQRGQDPTLIARLPSGWAVFGEQQFLRGYALLLPDPVVPDLNALRDAERRQFLLDMAALGDALLAETGALRINYAMFGNQEPALHAHVIPRYRDEQPNLAMAQPWAYDWSAATPFDAASFASLRSALLARLTPS